MSTPKAVLIAALAFVSCHDRNASSGIGEEQGQIAEVLEEPRIGGPFTHWIPVTGPVNLASHGHTATWGVLWGGESEVRELYGEPIEVIWVSRRGQEAESEVVLVRMVIRAGPEAELSFRRLATRLFGVEPSFREIYSDPQRGWIIRLEFRDHGTAEFAPKNGDVFLRSSTCLLMEEKMQQRRTRPNKSE